MTWLRGKSQHTKEHSKAGPGAQLVEGLPSIAEALGAVPLLHTLSVGL